MEKDIKLIQPRVQYQWKRRIEVNSTVRFLFQKYFHIYFISDWIINETYIEMLLISISIVKNAPRKSSQRMFEKVIDTVIEFPCHAIKMLLVNVPYDAVAPTIFL